MACEFGRASAGLLQGNSRDDDHPHKSGQIIVFVIVYACYSPLLVGLTASACWAWVRQTPLHRLSSHTRELMEGKKRKEKKRFSWTDKTRLTDSASLMLTVDFQFYVPLCGSSLRACLLGGELLWSLSGYSLLRELLGKKYRQSH